MSARRCASSAVIALAALMRCAAAQEASPPPPTALTPEQARIAELPGPMLEPPRPAWRWAGAAIAAMSALALGAILLRSYRSRRRELLRMRSQPSPEERAVLEIVVAHEDFAGSSLDGASADRVKQIVRDYLAARWLPAARERTTPEIRIALEALGAGVPQKRLHELIEVLACCDEAAYAGASAPVDDALDVATNAIARIVREGWVSNGAAPEPSP